MLYALNPTVGLLRRLDPRAVQAVARAVALADKGGARLPTLLWQHLCQMPEVQQRLLEGGSGQGPAIPPDDVVPASCGETHLMRLAENCGPILQALELAAAAGLDDAGPETLAAALLLTGSVSPEAPEKGAGPSTVPGDLV